MVRDSMIGLGDTLNKVGMLLGRLPDHEKRRVRLEFIQQIQQPGRVFRIWPIVERQSDKRLISLEIHDRAHHMTRHASESIPQRFFNAIAHEMVLGRMGNS
jgi:hypothetical protein